jgi:flavin-dependent dehydrogenase
MSAREDYDLVIIGASFAGLTCARAAALRGLKTLVLEAKSDPGARIHTTGILVKEAAEERDVPDHLVRPVSAVRLYAPNLTHTDLAAPGYYFLTTNMPGLMRWLAAEAERAGADIRCASRFTTARRERERIVIEDHNVSARFLIGADGARSTVAEVFNLGRNRRVLIGMEQEYAAVPGLDDNFLHCFLDARLAPGYIGWAAPAPDVIQVGLATDDRHRPDMAAFREKLSTIFELDEDRIVERRSGVIPCGGIVRPFADGNVMLIGDAAGMVSPLTAGGIQMAFRFGRRAGQLTADYLKRNGPPPQQTLARQLPSMMRKRALRWLLEHVPSNAIYNAVVDSWPMRKFAAGTYFHDRRIKPAPVPPKAEAGKSGGRES